MLKKGWANGKPCCLDIYGPKFTPINCLHKAKTGKQPYAETWILPAVRGDPGSSQLLLASWASAGLKNGMAAIRWVERVWIRSVSHATHRRWWSLSLCCVPTRRKKCAISCQLAVSGPTSLLTLLVRLAAAKDAWRKGYQRARAKEVITLDAKRAPKGHAV